MFATMKIKLDNVKDELFYAKNAGAGDYSVSYDTDRPESEVTQSVTRGQHEKRMSIIASASNDLKFHQWPDGVIQQTYVPAKYDDGHIKSISWGKDGSWMVLVPYSGPAEIISIRDSVKLLQTIDDVYHPTCATFQNSTKKNIALGTLAGQVLVYDIKGRSIKKRYPRACSTILQLQYNSKDTHLAASCTNGEILVFNSMTSHLSSSYKIPKSDTVSAINFHRTRRNMLGAGSEEGVVAAWDINTSAPLLEIQAHHAPVTALAYSPIRTDMLVTSGLDRRFTFYDILAKKCIYEVEVRSSITALDFSYCGTYLGLGSQAGGIVLYDTRNLNKPISAFQAHDGKRIRQLLFQKVLLPKDEQNNSTFEVLMEVDARQQREVETSIDQTMDSAGVMLCDDLSPQVGEGEPGKAPSEDGADSFLAAIGWENSSQTESELKENTVGLGITDGVRKWMEVSSRRSVHMLEQKSALKTPAATKQMSSTPKCLLGQDLPTSTVSPIVPENETLRKSVSLHQSTPVNPDLPNSQGVSNNQGTPSNHFNVSALELKKILKEVVKEVVKEEFSSQLEAYKSEVRNEFAETLGHMRRHFLDLQMSIVKEFVSMESALEKMNSVTVKEFVCDDFLLNQNNKLLKELDSLKEQMVERDLCRRKF